MKRLLKRLIRKFVPVHCFTLPVNIFSVGDVICHHIHGSKMIVLRKELARSVFGMQIHHYCVEIRDTTTKNWIRIYTWLAHNDLLC